MDMITFFRNSIEDFLIDDTDYADYSDNEILELFKAIERI
jgi:hypothetical protein